MTWRMLNYCPAAGASTCKVFPGQISTCVSLHFPTHSLDVPGLAEKRPSLIIGDTVLARKRDSTLGKPSRGVVHFVEERRVGLKFHQRFNSLNGQKYNIRFELGRLPLLRMHQALGTSFNDDRVLFPHSRDLKRATTPTTSEVARIRCFNSLVGQNPPQLQAVSVILSLPPGSPPFIVFGP
jgi:helicase MOV-10